MDSNGTRHQLLLGLEDWGNCLDGRGLPLAASWPDSRAPKPKSKDSAAANHTNLAWDGVRQELTLQPRLFRYVAAPDDEAVDINSRRGAARDRYGNWYWIDETSRKLRVNSSGTKRTTEFWPRPAGTESCAPAAAGGDFRPVEAERQPAHVFGGLAVTEDHYLVVGTIEPKGILIFDLHAGGPPRQLLWPQRTKTGPFKFEPFDMAARAGGGVFIFDRANRRYWELDRDFYVVIRKPISAAAAGDDLFRPLADAPGYYAGGAAHAADAPPARPVCRRVQKITLAASVRIGLKGPVAIESLPDASVLILDNPPRPKPAPNKPPAPTFARVHRYRDGRHVGRAKTDAVRELIEEDERAGFKLVAHDFAFVPARAGAGGGDASVSRLFVASADGNQSFAFQITWGKRAVIKLTPEAVYLPMRLFGGKALVGAGSDAYYDFDERFVPLARQRRPRYAVEATLETPGRAAAGQPSRVFDGREPDCVWHRLMLDACIPAGTRVEVWSRAANHPDDLAFAEWLREPGLYLRGDGSELPFAGRIDRRGAPALKSRADGKGTWELLFQRARGRYLQLRLRLAGDERATPRLRALRAYYPRFSYLANYLPSVYREDDVSSSFLDRFLANLEGTFTSVEDKIAAAQILFDVRSAPADALDWLADWYGVALDPRWDERRRRLFIKHALHFFAYRGTRHGLELALRLVFDECIDDSAFRADERAACAQGDPRGVRIVEQFRARRQPGPAADDPFDTNGPALLPKNLTGRWRPADRAETLHRLYRERLNLAAGELFPVRDPGGERGRAWREFARAALGFVPGATDAETDAWRDFLARRYGNVRALDDAHGTATGDRRKSFADVGLFAELPAGGARLADWYDFEAVVVQTLRAAHRFTVLLPVPDTATFDSAEQRTRGELTKRVVDLEKPAHTVFDVRFYWAMFRIGFARLGDDTVVDLGARAPALMPPMRLGGEHLAESYLAPGHPQSVAERAVVGRGRQTDPGRCC
ncbi:MAG: phage tail protein [Acidobacteria bacterium]|nr:phage tail protein [Acidobacteriota bacterium]